MGNEKFDVEDFVPKDAGDEDFAAFVGLQNLYLSETDPDDPPHTIEFQRSRLSNIPENLVRVNYWIVREKTANKMVAFGVGNVPLTDNFHLMFFDMYVHPDYRRQGIGKALLQKFVEMAENENRRLWVTFVYDQVESGVAFLEAMQATKGLADETNQVKIEDVDPELMRSWIETGQEKAAGFEVGFWEGLPPEEELERVAKIIRVAANDAPWEDLEIEDMEITPESLKENHKSNEASGMTQYLVYARDLETGELAGYTQVYWHPEKAHILQQSGTAVDPKYRGKGLGRWVKAAMFEEVVKRLPEVKLIRTGNAGSNAPMLKINHEMGFALYKSGGVWQVEVEKVRGFLGQ